MLDKILAKFKTIFEAMMADNSLERYVAAGKPESSEDVDRLTREFYNNQTRKYSHYY